MGKRSVRSRTSLRTSASTALLSSPFSSRPSATRPIRPATWRNSATPSPRALQVDQDEVAVGAAGDDVEALPLQGVGQGAGVLDHGAGVELERRLQRLAQ